MNKTVLNFLSLSAFLFASTPALAEGRYADLVACGHAIRAVTFNMSPTHAYGQGVITSHIDMPKGMFDRSELTLFLGEGKKPAVASLTADAIWYNPKLNLIRQDTRLAAIVSSEPQRLRTPRHPLFDVVHFVNYPVQSEGQALIGDGGEMYGYPAEGITVLDASMTVKDPAQLAALTGEIAARYKLAVANIARALSDRVLERTGRKMRSSKSIPGYNFDIMADVADDLREMACLCKGVPGLERVDVELSNKLLSLPDSVLVLENILDTILGKRASEIRPLHAGDLSCNYM